jgi:type I restriction enzyme S subunit
MKDIEATEDEIRSLQLVPGDVLLNEGGDRDKLGRGWIWEGQIAECIHQNHVFRVRLNPLLAVPKFVSHYANHFGQKYFFDEGKQTTNLASINMTKLRALPVPSPPVAEQERLLTQLEDHLSMIDDLDRTVDANLTRAARLRQAILKKAFEGKLVPQDPNDEPASVLLERIRSTRAHAPTRRRRDRS